MLITISSFCRNYQQNIRGVGRKWAQPAPCTLDGRQLRMFTNQWFNDKPDAKDNCDCRTILHTDADYARSTILD